MKKFTIKNNLHLNFDSFCNFEVLPIVSIDAEWEVPKVVTDMETRSFDDVISLQVCIALHDKCYSYVLTRKRGDKPFYFRDLMKVVKDVIPESSLNNSISNSSNPSYKGKRPYKNVHNKVKGFEFILTGFWIGVDVSIFKDWDKVINSRFDNVVTLQQQAVATTKPIKASIKTACHKKGLDYMYASINVRDTILLAPPKCNLAGLGKMVKYPKLDTEEWDVQDGYDKGYYKSHMRALLKNRPDDYFKYAMVDAEIPVCYLHTWLQLIDELANNDEMCVVSSSNNVVVPLSASSFVSSCVSTYCKKRDNFDFIKLLDNKAEEDKNFLYTLSQFVRQKADGKPLYDVFEDIKHAHPYRDTFLNWDTFLWDWDTLRKGYYQNEYRLSDEKHKDGRLDKSSAQEYSNSILGLRLADKAFYGGHNVSYTFGKIENRRIIDIDLKSAYNTGGHLIPDFLGGLLWDNHTDVNKVLDQEFINNLPNGAFTVGFVDCIVQYPNDTDIVLTPYRASDDSTPRYLRSYGSNNRYNYAAHTLTDCINAYENGATVLIRSYAIPVQSVLRDGTDFKLDYLDHLHPAGVVQDFFAQQRSKYDKSNPFNALYKLLGNGVYGKTGQGLHAHTKRSYEDNKSYYLPYSSSTNAILASQYTAITRYLLSRMLKLTSNVEKSVRLESITTDGFMISIDKNVDYDKFVQQLEHDVRNDIPLWTFVADTFFNGEFFEIKGNTTSDGWNVRTRFQVTEDETIDALAGIKGYNGKQVYDALEQSRLMLDMSQKRFSSLIDEKHNKTLKKCLSVNNMVVSGYLNYDFTRKPVKFHKGNEHGWFETKPFGNIDDLDRYRDYALLLSRNWCITDNDNGDLFLMVMKQYTDGYKDTIIKNTDRDTLATNDSYCMLHLLRYIMRYHVNKVTKYRNLFDADIDGYKFSDYYTFDTFKRLCKRLKKSKVLINFLAIKQFM